jgi:hypothetical protein
MGGHQTKIIVATTESLEATLQVFFAWRIIMENEFLNKIKRIKDTENLITLQKTKKIAKDDLPEWLQLKEAYDETEDSIQRTIVSLFNSIMYQRRLYFVLTRDVTKRLVREDKNHKIKTAFRNNYWQTIIAKCTNELKMLELVAIENNVAVYKCIDETIRNYIKIDEQKQFQETIDFIKSINGKSEFGDGIRDGVGDVESKKDRKEEKLERKQVRKAESEEVRETEDSKDSISLSSNLTSEDIEEMFSSQRSTNYVPATITEYEQHLGIDGSAGPPGNGSAGSDSLSDVDYMNDAVKLHFLLAGAGLDAFEMSKMYEHYIPQLLIRRPHLAVKLLDKFISHPKSQISPEQRADFEDTAYVHYEAFKSEELLWQNIDQQENVIEEVLKPSKPSQRQVEIERRKELVDGFEKHFPATVE